MKNVYFAFLIFSFLACKKAIIRKESSCQPTVFSYKECKAPFFFAKLVTNHLKDFYAKDPTDFEYICNNNALNSADSLNLKNFYTFKILHKLLTSKEAQNGSKGAILNIPYFWHWTTPNPRYEIICRKTNLKLNQIKPPKEFSQYQSYAAIDRTPYLFLSEMLSEGPLYSSPNCGTFSTFGWCSEREMAFVCLLGTLDYEGKVITNSNHSWSEFIVKMNSKKDGTKSMLVKVDNTFDELEWKAITDQEIQIWRKKTAVGQGNWYNQKGNSITENKRLTNLVVSTKVMNNIEEKVVDYIRK